MTTSETGTGSSTITSSVRASAAAGARLSGVVVPVLTPFARDLAQDAARYVRHCRWLLSQGCAALAAFGTTSEANSLSVDEREALLEHLLGEGIAPPSCSPGPAAARCPTRCT
jgi:4-hydroxy-tetrahydrodipicolinate synthase